MSEHSECEWYRIRCDDDSGVVSGIRYPAISNGLKGEIPSELQYLTGMKFLELGNASHLYWQVRKGEGLDAVAINARKAMINEIAGPILTYLANMTDLINLQLTRNSFTGTIPDYLYDMNFLRAIDLTQNLLSGTLSPKIAQLSSLRSAHFVNNTFTGGVPAEIGNIADLNDLRLHGNNFNGSMPDALCSLGLRTFTADCAEVDCSCCSTCYPLP